MAIKKKKRSLLKSTSLQRKKRRARTVKIVLATIAALLLSGGFVYASHLPALQVKDISVRGVSALSESDIANVAEDVLNGKYLHLFPKRNAFLLPRQTMLQTLKEKYPRILSVSLSTKNISHAEIAITEREPFALWCDNVDPASLLDGSCYFMDTEGYIFAEAPQFSDNVYIKYHSRGSSTPVTSTFSPSTSLTDLTRFSNDLSALGFIPSNVYAENEGVYTLVFSHGEKIIFNDRTPLESTLNNFKVLIREERISAASTKAFDYADLRFGNKVYFKPLGE